MLVWVGVERINFEANYAPVVLIAAVDLFLRKINTGKISKPPGINLKSKTMTQFSKSIKFLALSLAVLLFTQCTEDDLNSPIITLNGDSPEFVELGGTYVDSGAAARDTEDGDIFIINYDESALDTDVVGSYDILFSATDEAGNTGSEVRIVHVFAQGSDFAGVYEVVEDCSDGNTYTYDVTITAGASPNTAIISNFGNYGFAVLVDLNLTGDTNSNVSVDESIGGADFLGLGFLTTGTTTSMVFTLDYSADDGVSVLTCDAVFTKQ